MSEFFSIKDLMVTYKTFEGEKDVLSIRDLSINKGETFGIVGESGSGKTVLALTILKLLAMPPGHIRSGQILFNGEDLLLKTEKEMQKIRGQKISMIFQDPMSTLNPVFTVGEQISRVIANNQQCSRKEAQKKAFDMIELVKLPDAANIMTKYPHELSGGQRQRIIIATALSCGAEFLIADEPTRNLDVTIQAGVLKLIAQLQKELKITVLFIANNLGLVSATCNRLGILHQGEIVESGSVHQILRSPMHPYTKTLLNAIPKNKSQKLDLSKILVNNSEKIEGITCNYAGRCFDRHEDCRGEKPELREVGDAHFVACYKTFEGGENSNEYTASQSV